MTTNGIEFVSLDRPTPSVRRELLQKQDWRMADGIAAVDEETLPERDFDPEATIIEYATTAIDRIVNKGESTWTAVRSHFGYLKNGDTNPESCWYGIGYKYWELYCKILLEQIPRLTTTRPFRASNLPSWEDYAG
ncbi:hypothetical protein IKG31_02660 [Candidatus Saccharibacteria bacterium]|nr:hypothetical protein [Candidatus Saccharibacteria bacterium]